MTLVEKLINEHNQVVQYAEESLEKDGFLSGMKKAIDIVKNHNGWISVDDELPQLFESVLTLSSKNTYQILALQEHYFFDFARNECVNINYITHWQPLPQPPKE